MSWKAEIQFMDVSHTAAKLQAYDGVSDWWERVAEKVRHRQWIEIPAMRGLAGDLTGQNVLVLGCGAGGEVIWALEQGAEMVLGVDGSSGQVAQARARVGDRARVLYADIEGWAMPAEWFDLVVGSLVFDHLRCLDEVLVSVRNALRVGGRVVFSVPHPVLMGAEHTEDYLRCMLGYDIRDEGDHRISGDYLTEREIVIGVGPDRAPVRIWVRSVSRILTAVLDAGLTITAVREPCPPEPVVGDPPDLQAFKSRYRRLPHYLIVEATRPGAGD